MMRPEVVTKDGLPIREHRRFIRHPLIFPLTFKVIERGAPAETEEERSRTINISMGGLLFAARRPVKIDSTIMIKMPFEDRVFNVKGRVVHCRKNIETKLYNIGVAFFKLNVAFKVKLIEQLYLISEFRDLRSMQLGKTIPLERASREWIKRYSKRFRKLYW